MSERIIVLVHGAFADASGFAGVIRELNSAGHLVIAPPNPLRSLASDVAAVSAVVKAIDGPVLLVGHSYGGAVITQASAGLDNVTGLVYLAAFGIDVSESCASVQAPFPPSMLSSTSYPTPYDAPGAPQGPDLYIAKEQFRETFCADVPVDLADVMFATQRPLSAAALTENATAAGWKDQALLVSGVRTRQRHPAGRGAIHGQAHGRRHRIDQRIAHGVYRQPGARARLHHQGARRLTPARLSATRVLCLNPCAAFAAFVSSGKRGHPHGIRASTRSPHAPPRLRQRTAVR